MDKILEYWEVLAAAGTGMIGFFSGSKMRKADALQNMQNSYDLFTKHQTEQLSLIREEMSTLKKENSELRNDVRQLQKDNTLLHKEISLLTKENSRLILLCEDLKKENRQLKLQINR